MISAYCAKYSAHELMCCHAKGDLGSLSAALCDVSVSLNLLPSCF